MHTCFRVSATELNGTPVTRHAVNTFSKHAARASNRHEYTGGGEPCAMLNFKRSSLRFPKACKDFLRHREITENSLPGCTYRLRYKWELRDHMGKPSFTARIAGSLYSTSSNKIQSNRPRGGAGQKKQPRVPGKAPLWSNLQPLFTLERAWRWRRCCWADLNPTGV